MPKFAANLSMLFAELPYLDRFSAAAAAGFEAVEVLFPYEFAAKETQRALLANGLELLLINSPPPRTGPSTFEPAVRAPLLSMTRASRSKWASAKSFARATTTSSPS